MDKDELKKKLTSQEFHVTQEKGTEHPFHNEYWDSHEEGMYLCKVCGTPLFKSDAKFDSGTGWPSFDDALPGAIKTETDMSLGVPRTEIMCATCGSHLGHIFNDTPPEVMGNNGTKRPRTTGKRFCTNSASLTFKHKEKVK